MTYMMQVTTYEYQKKYNYSLTFSPCWLFYKTSKTFSPSPSLFRYV